MNLDTRLSLVPWLSNSDLVMGPDAVWDVLYHSDEKASCWPVPVYDKDAGGVYHLIVHATKGNGNDGGTITLAISRQPRFDVYAKESFVIAQRNPVRHPFRVDADFWREEGA